MAKEPKKPPKSEELSPYTSAVGPIPPDHWDNDQRFTGKPPDTSPGSVYNYLKERGAQKPKK